MSSKIYSSLVRKLDVYLERIGVYRKIHMSLNSVAILLRSCMLRTCLRVLKTRLATIMDGLSRRNQVLQKSGQQLPTKQFVF